MRIGCFPLEVGPTSLAAGLSWDREGLVAGGRAGKFLCQSSSSSSTRRASTLLPEPVVGGLRVDGRVDGLERCGQLSALLPAGILQAVADQVHDAGLQRRGRKRLREYPKFCVRGLNGYPTMVG